MDTKALTQEIHKRLLTAVEGLQDEWEDHDVPSPSGIYSCLRQQWFTGRRVPRSLRVPAKSIKKMEAGKLIEDFWREAFRVAELPMTQPGRFQVSEEMTGEADGVAVEMSGTLPGLPQGMPLLAEFKDLGAWGYMNFVLYGLKKAEPKYYYQVQCYMHALSIPVGVVLAGMADSSSTVWLWETIKKKEVEELFGCQKPLPDFWVEVVEYGAADYYWAQQRGSTVKYLIDHETDAAKVPKDYEGKEVDPVAILSKKRGRWPCGYCGWAPGCLAADGLPWKEEYDKQSPAFQAKSNQDADDGGVRKAGRKKTRSVGSPRRKGAKPAKGKE